MPLYQYGCPGCGYEFEVIRTIEDRHNVPCPKCSDSTTLRTSAFSFRMDTPVTFVGHGGKVLDRKSGGINAPIGRPNESNLSMV